MARTEHHSAYAFLIYYMIWIFWKGSFIIGGEYRYVVFWIVIFGAFPDFDAIYWLIKRRGEGGISTDFQHHLYFWTHWPISYTPLLILFIISLIFNFFPEYFLIPVVGIYSHLIFDSISCGDGIMWGKIPWKKDRYARYVNGFPGEADGYHGVYWEARYRKTFIFKVGTVCSFLSLGIISYFLISTMITSILAGGIGFSGYYVMPIVYFGITLWMGLKKPPKEYLKEPPEGRYADYRLNPDYINGLSERNKKKHLKKYRALLEERGVLEKVQPLA